ncbi:unnamed protein product [Nippostrongylus brasiliensis]|uniref:Peptidase A2 domain-containing protein n=1 Tax=Nippostrongylus brasiliensis TaxID=27835 RepID=A0A0N4YHA9_NIPBR|nr:unnamed protein product [Nippostrongylus brasiliensis]
MVGSTSGNEDELLRTPEQDEMEYENVSECFKKQFDKLASKILGQVATIGITCDAELGKLFRTDDARRDAVVSSVREQTALVKEIIRTTLAEMSELGKQQSGTRVVEILTEAGIRTSTQLREHLASDHAAKRIVVESCKILSCHEEDLTSRIEELVAAVEQLRREVEHLGNELKRTAVQEPLTGTVADLDSFEPEVLREYAERRIRARTRSATAVGHSARPRQPENGQSRRRPEAYASLVDKWLGATVAGLQLVESSLFGERAVEEINIFGLEAMALLDTGSQTTIIPLLLLKRAVESNVDLDKFITRISHPEVKVRDASGNVMDFLDVVQVPITFRGHTEEISAYVGRGLDETVILGTNALDRFGMYLQQVGAPSTKEKNKDERKIESSEAKAAVKHRLFLPAKGVGTLRLTCAAATSKVDVFLQSAHAIVGDGICSSVDGEVDIPVLNTSEEAIVFRAGEVVGEWKNDEWVKPKHMKPDEDMMDLAQPVDLARLISINDHERCVERKRLLMLDPKHVFVTSSGVRKAFLFFKKCCDHVFRSLATHDGSFLALLHDGGTGLPIEQLNEANNEGVRYARANDWDDIAASEAAPKKLIIVPDSFSLMDTFFKTHPTVSCRIYRDLNEIGSILDRSRASFCVLIGPTSDRPFPKKDWCKLASSLAAAARNDTKLLAVAPPRGDDAYEQNRTDINEAFELARSVAVLAKHNIVSCIPAIESGREPSHGPGAKPRTSTSEKYSKKVLLDYFDSLSSYLKGEVDIPPLEEKTSRSARTRRYFKERKAGRIAKNPRPDRLFRNNNQAFAMAVQPQMYPMPPQGQYVMVPTTSSYPPRTFSARGRGHQNRRRF